MAVRETDAPQAKTAATSEDAPPRLGRLRLAALVLPIAVPAAVSAWFVVLDLRQTGAALEGAASHPATLGVAALFAAAALAVALMNRPAVVLTGALAVGLGVYHLMAGILLAAIGFGEAHAASRMALSLLLVACGGWLALFARAERSPA